MKTEIYTSEQIFAVHKLLEQVYNLYPTVTAEQKTIRSIAFDLEEKFNNKRKKLIKQNSVFEVGKTHKMGLKYHEENTLKCIIYDLINTVNADKPKFDLQTVHDALHKRLA
jgi:uncharacterized membrane protein